MLKEDIISIVSEEIAYFLSSETYAAIPGFGCFRSERQSAMINKDGSLLMPESNKITFEQNLEETDSGFIDYFREYHPGTTIIDDFIVSFIQKIKEDKNVLLPELGLCVLNKEGNVHFESLDQSYNVLGFSAETISLKPLSKIEVDPSPVEVNAPSAAARVPVNANSRSKLIRIGMVLSSLVLLIVFLSKFNWTDSAAAVEFQKIPTNFNVSPQDQDVIIASMDGDAPSGEISPEQKNEILDRQRLMSEALPESKMQLATIVTNTFGSASNVEKQLNLISELGYKGSTVEKANGLVSTLITIEYQKEEELEALFDEVKIHFHRAKLKM